MDDLNALVAPYAGFALIALAVVCLVLIVVVVGLTRRTSALDRRLAGLTRGAEGSLESILDAHLDKVYAVAREVDELAARTAVLERAQRRAFQRLGLVRFNPFEDTGGNQSFALALLDAARRRVRRQQPPHPDRHPRLRQGDRGGQGRDRALGRGGGGAAARAGLRDRVRRRAPDRHATP